MRGVRFGAAIGSLVLLAGCAAHVRPPERDGVVPVAPPAPTASPSADPAEVWARWDLKPLPPAPPAPAAPAIALKATGPVPVFSSVPTKDRVVFVTLDDGNEKDPRFLDMLADLRVPVTLFLTDTAIQNDYGYFRKLQASGAVIENHTVTHPQLPLLGVDGQRRELCDDQKVLRREYGRRPVLVRPPYGEWNSVTQQAAAECGLRAIVLWRASMQIHDFQYDDPERKLRPGDILLAHFRGPKELKGETMTEMFAELLRRIRKQGFAVARLEDYVRAP
ncbi:Peptidoglycan-N-acetylmuramic acid deacetylase PdaA precursor [Actinomadura rubteroloni]|uniref:Peptidoglycan-N-acetylmuramic acid deacetylase PdaA n=1 Tax=Actinomadura rubteroloni TaxID=1926885 RepID=A0A2P4UNA7_9ACTN|nr:polysaccharide deacetylase family protein [Actinomadura rubteroloni]POM26533.1 Peptidoglycan-N-acetylmuramic acid deacetylase PdaA precursor [Actinomadura rubteroloni]